MGDTHRRHQRIWCILQRILRLPVHTKFNMIHEAIDVDGPMLLISNHVSSWDPILVAMSLGDKQVYYVASEHLFRKGFTSEVLRWLVDPIPRSKGNAGTDTVRACLKHLKAGHSVCIFAEGEQGWDGRNNPIFPATGKLAKLSGATLVTYRLEGAYLSLPRWANNIRKGKVYGHPVGVYPPEVLKTMAPEEITNSINRDISEDAWERQQISPVDYKGKNLAEGLERMLYLCPNCKRIGTLRSEGDKLSCDCGLDLRYRPDGAFEPGTPFANIASWEDWQKQALLKGDFFHGEDLFSDTDVTLTRIDADHGETQLTSGTLIQYPDRLSIESFDFTLDEIDNVAMTRTHILLFSSKGTYYQLSADKGINFRKYLEVLKMQSAEKQTA